MPEQEKFYGDGRPKENAHDYKNTLMMRFVGKGLSDGEKMAALGYGMASGSIADTWFDDPAQRAHTTWAAMSAAFDTKWPKRAALRRVGQDAIEDLLSEKLDAADIGKRVPYAGGEEFGQVVWIRRMVRIAGDIPDPQGLFIGVVREKMPMIMQDLLGPGAVFANWAALETAVVAINRASIVNAQVKEARLVKMTEAATVKTSSYSVTSRAPMQLPTAIHPQRFTPQFYPPYPPSPTAPGPAQLSPRTFRPDAERLIDLLKNVPTHHPATEAGRAAYRQQISDWDARNGNRGPNELRPYPLTPGTAPLDSSGDCYNCALLGHTTIDCPNPPMPPHEKKWRQIAASIRNGARRTPQAATPVHYVAAPYNFDPNAYNYGPWYPSNPYTSYPDPAYANDQGNGEGSSN
ncbi:hypothetical protein C8J57DRAFT_1231440 [Mycena rebaudengoi]|nr:hypothetical protein C8J57DRAFT_1231440 [Mycena rebaudengoi]